MTFYAVDKCQTNICLINGKVYRNYVIYHAINSGK